MPPSAPQQLLSRLAPLREVLARIDALVHPVEPRDVELAAAAGRVLAADVLVEAPLPATAVALRDGWAVRAEMVADAGPYAPAPLTPAPVFVEIGAPLPADADAVLPSDAVTLRGGVAEATATVAPGEGVLAAGADAEPGRPLCRAGTRLRAIDLALLRAAGVPRVAVRAPRLRLVTANAFVDAVDDTVAPLIARAIDGEGGAADIVRVALDGALDRVLQESEHADAIVVIGGTGAGRHDASVRTLARLGQVDIHGVGLTPGESAALGAINGRAVLVLPGRLDAALAAWLVLGRHLLRRLTGRNDPDIGTPVQLARKIASTVGLAEVVLMRRGEGGVEPLASGSFPLHVLAEADGWVLVAPDREGFPPGATVDMYALP
ncbi:MAG TPA: molybdopterin-binding protein [Xanthobacteraceae bacterium]|nr:molybdopterin-binding protein [Xanthobacteraceae bacterium]